MENKTAREIIRDRSDTKQDYFLYVEGDRDEEAEDVIIRWMEKYSNQQNKSLEALVLSFRSKLSGLFLQEYDRHFHITSERHGKI